MTSLYHHCYFKFENDPRNHFQVDLYRQNFPFEDYDDVRSNLPGFIKQQFSEPLTPAFTWTDFVNTWFDFEGRVDVFYEEFRRDTVGSLSRALVTLSPPEPVPNQLILEQIVEARSFKRAKAAEIASNGGHSFLRKGAIEGWRQEFSDEAHNVFESYAADALTKLGYPLSTR